MERRDDVLIQALEKNADETQRWEAFKADNESAIRNLDMFSKQLTVEVMVPIGSKAFMPGQLIHTNELIVGHYQDYFSACSAHKAKEICQHRLRLAEDHLKKLEVEANLWQNKLEKPMLEGAVPSSGEIEIIEDYVEEAHNKWLQQHKESVRRQKQKERIERESADKGEKIFRDMEDSEILEELGLNPDLFDEDKITEVLENSVKARQSETKVCDKPNQLLVIDEKLFEMLDELEKREQKEETEMDLEAEQNLQSTNNLVNNLMNSQMEKTSSKLRVGRATNKVEQTVEDLYSTDEEDDDPDQPAEVKLIREQLAQLPTEEHEEFLSSQLKILKSKMRQLQKEQFISEELTHLMNVVVCLEDDLHDIIFDQEQAAESDESVSIPPDLTENKSRRISFAKTDEHLLFRKEESVAQMMAKKNKQPAREVIALDEPVQPDQKEAKAKHPVDTSQIMQKVEQNLDFVKEHQSLQDFDMINQILDASTGRINTLHISFKHSDAVAASNTQLDMLVPGSPADFYSIYQRMHAKKEFPIYVNSFEGEQELKVPILKEEARKTAYDDPRTQFSKIPVKSSMGAKANNEGAGTETKSILRNKSAVKQEMRSISENVMPANPANTNNSKKNRNRKKKQQQRTVDDELRDMSAYQKVMQDLVEKEPTVPEPLPEGKYIDAHAPKQRISRFKEQRSKQNKT